MALHDTSAAVAGLHRAYALLQDQKSNGTNGGGFTSGAWRTRDLNTEVFDPAGIVTLSSNQFTLGAGTYYISAIAPALAVEFHQAKIRNVTDSTDPVVGYAIYAQAAGLDSVPSLVVGRFTITGTKTFELQHQCSQTRNTDGFGAAGGFSVGEVYSSVGIWME